MLFPVRKIVKERRRIELEYEFTVLNSSDSTPSLARSYGRLIRRELLGLMILTTL